MIKIKSFLFFSAFVFSVTPLICVHAETPEELFQKVFGKNQEIKKSTLDVSLGDFYLGPVSVSLIGEKIKSVSGSELAKILLPKIRPEKAALYSFGTTDIDPSKLPFKITYHPSELRLAVEIPPGDLKAQDANVTDELIPYYAKNAINPAEFSFVINYKLEDVQVKKLDQVNYFQAQTDSFMNIKNIVAENQINYLSTRSENPWYRQNSKMTYDRPSHMQRLELGDVNYPIIGLQQPHSMGGVSFYRDFSLNPYRTSGPTSSFEYDVETRSLVRTYINNIILKTEYMNPGRYSVKDIPLNNGINKIIIELTDDFGKKKIFVFNEASSLDLLAPGLNRYSMAAGYLSTDTEKIKKYDEKNGAFVTGFFQHGVNKFWSASGYVQRNSAFTLLGTNNILSTNYGNWGLDAVGSKNKFKEGEAAQITYQLNLFGAYWYNTHTFTAKVEYRTPWFNENGENFENRFDILTNLSYSVPIFEKFNYSLGGNYQNPKIADNAKFGFDTSITAKVFDSSSLTFFWSRNRDDHKIWATQLYFFLNITLGDHATFASAFYDKMSESKRLTAIHDNGKQLNDLKISASANDSLTARDGSLDLQYNTALADLGGREEIIHNNSRQTGSRTSLRFLSAFAFVHNGGDSGFSISRPIANSFVLFKPNENWLGQHFGVQSTSGSDSTSGIFGESLISGLTPYQYKQLQLDPSNLEPGYVLGQESYVVYPNYLSGHLFVVGKSGKLVLKGMMVDKNKNPLALRVGFWTSKAGKVTPFFTGREGEFFIEGVEPTMGKLELNDEQFDGRELNLETHKKGLIDIGNIELPYKEGHL